jgi:MerR family transcriptional regulator, light-induced transcriptional regulator
VSHHQGFAQRHYTIREVAAQTGLSTAALRKWEDRYGLVEPVRLANGYRCYTEHDVALLQWVVQRVNQGAMVSIAAEEAKAKLLEGWKPTPPPVAIRSPDYSTQRARLLHHIMVADATTVSDTMDDLFAMLSPETALTEIMEPVMHQVGQLWADGNIAEYREAIAAAAFRDRLSRLDDRIPSPNGPHLITACIPGDRHELGVMVFSLLARRRACRVTYLGASPAPGALRHAVLDLRPDAVCLGVTLADRLEPAMPELTRLADAIQGLTPRPPLFIGGQGLRGAPDLPGLSRFILYRGPADQLLSSLLRMIQPAS